VVAHVQVAESELRRSLDEWIPRTGSGSFSLGGQRNYTWKRSPPQISFDQGRIGIHSVVTGSVSLFGSAIDFPIDLTVHAEPVITADYQARFQSVDVKVTSDDPRLKMAQGVAGALDTIRDAIAEKLKSFSYDLKPYLTDAYARIAKPIDLPLGDAHGCAELKVSSIEAGPSVLANGIEKDVAVVVTPSVTLPCAAAPNAPSPPPLANVPSLPTGPFTVTVPIVARYEELQKAMGMAFTNGKLFFSKEFPQLYMDQPEVYSASDQLVLKVHMAGPIAKAGIHANLDGNIYFAGHPAVVDNELRVPDLQPTIETSSFLLKLKAALDSDSIRNEARNALRLDLGQRLTAVRERLSSELAFPFSGGAGCMRSEVQRIEVTGVYPHGSYLRLYVAVTAQTSVHLPCPAPITANQPPAP
jgi:hypothetical protein